MSCAQKLNFDVCEPDIPWGSTNISIESSGCDMSDSLNSSNECLSPVKTSVHPRKLIFSQDDEDEIKLGDSPIKHSSISPPYKRVRALKLFDTPATPKTILHKSSTPTHPNGRIACRINPSRLNVSAANNQTNQASSSQPNRLQVPSRLSGQNQHGCNQLRMEWTAGTEGVKKIADKEKDHDSSFDENCSFRSHTYPEANINPFTPDAMMMNKKKRTLSKTSMNSPSQSFNCSALDMSGDSDVLEQPCKKLRESNISRYHAEFVELSLLGCGTFGSVHRCRNRLDGCVYALKRSLKPVAGSVCEKNALNEVYAHAVLGKHQHVVRYYSAWAEDDHMIIQNEYCDGGSLEDVLETKGALNESQLLVLLAHVADGLKYIHSMQLVHMDIKPGNIFLSHEPGGSAKEYDDDYSGNKDSADDGFEDNEETPPHPEVVYKIGDLGHVTCISGPQKIEEGDCRYLSNEVLQEDFSNLTKADIFALGLTVYEAGGGGPLPKNGTEWHEIRGGNIKPLPNISNELMLLIKKMIDSQPNNRPSAAQILKNSLLCSDSQKTYAQLRRELEATKSKNKLLEVKLQEASRCIKSIAPTVAVALCAPGLNNNETHINLTNYSRGFKMKPRSGCQKSPKNNSNTSDQTSKPAFAYRRQTRSYKFGRSTSNVQF